MKQNDTHATSNDDDDTVSSNKQIEEEVGWCEISRRVQEKKLSAKN